MLLRITLSRCHEVLAFELSVGSSECRPCLVIERVLVGMPTGGIEWTSALPMTAGWDQLVPRWFAHLHPRWSTPVNSISCMAFVVFLLLVLANVGVHAQEAYQLLSNASTTHYELAYLAMFAVPLVGRAALRRRHQFRWYALRVIPSSHPSRIVQWRLALCAAPNTRAILSQHTRSG